MDVYIKKHAVNKRDVAFAEGNQNRLRTGVLGRGRYRTWTPYMMLRSSLLALDFLNLLVCLMGSTELKYC